MKYLFILRGLPASSKSTWVRENHLEPYTLSSDDYRLKLSSFTPDIYTGKCGINQRCNNEAWKRLYADLEYRMKHGEFTIVDATHLTRKSIEKYRKLAKQYFYKLAIIEFNADKETCIERDLHRREYSVGRKVIEDMDSRKEELPKSILRVDNFKEFISTRYRYIDLSVYNNVHVIGDIHGCYSAMDEFMSKTNIEEDAYIFVGDYFDRGIENYHVYDFIKNHIDLPNFFFVKGNHEQRIVEYLNGEAKNSTFVIKTLPELQRNNVSDKDLKRFLSKLYSFVWFYYGNQEYIVSHAGIVNENNISPFTAEDIFVKGVGKYEDMEQVCETFAKTSDMIQIFGHRNNNAVPIKINDKCYNVCGFPENGGCLEAITITNEGIKEHYIQNEVFSRENQYMMMVKRPDLYKPNNIVELVEVFRHSKYIKESVYGDISSFNFTKEAFFTDNWNQITNKARGLFINTEHNDIVARSYDKFFLLGQYEYSTIDKFEPPFNIYLKYDGFLGILSYDKYNDELLFCSKSVVSPYGEYAQWFEEALRKHIIDEERLKQFLKQNNVSFIFECILPEKDEHIIKYNTDRLIFLDAVSNTVEYNKPFTYRSYYSLIGGYFDSFVELKYGTEEVTLLSIDTLKNAPYIGGYVIEDKNGKMFKLKTYDYEAKKILRGLKDFYTDISTNARHELVYLTKEDCEKKYCKKFAPCVVDKVYEGAKKVIDEINENIRRRNNNG